MLLASLFSFFAFITLGSSSAIDSWDPTVGKNEIYESSKRNGRLDCYGSSKIQTLAGNFLCLPAPQSGSCRVAARANPRRPSKCFFWRKK